MSTVRVTGLVSSDDVGLHFRIARELQSVNRWVGRHWNVKHRESQAWEQAFVGALSVQCGANNLVDVLHVMNALPETKRVCDGRRVVRITRFAPSKRRFIRDDDNLVASVKPVLDALKRLGYVKDDRRKWIDLVVAPQQVSPDGVWWTHIDIERTES